MTTITIAMPVRNCANTLGLALRSLIDQSFADWELLLIDDGSTDQTFQIASAVADNRIKIISDNKCLGLAARLNQAILTCDSPFIARMDGDDFSYPHRFERQLEYMEKHPVVDVIGCWVVVFDADGKAIGKRGGPEKHSDICAKPFAGFSVIHPTFLGRHDWFSKFLYDEKLLRSQDQDLLLRAYQSSQFGNVQEILMGYREERIELRRLLKGRYYFAKSTWTKFGRDRQALLRIRALSEQISKGCIDCISVATGMGYRLLRHRALPLTTQEREKWVKAWKEISSSQKSLSKPMTCLR